MLAVYVAWRIKHASLGRAMLAIRENEMAARSMGIDVFGTRLLAFVLGAFFAGLAGGLMVHLVSVITPGSYGIPLAFNLVVMVVIGGTGQHCGRHRRRRRDQPARRGAEAVRGDARALRPEPGADRARPDP